MRRQVCQVCRKGENMPSSNRPLFFRRPSTYNYRKTTTTTTTEPLITTSTLTPTRSSAGKRAPPRRRFTAPRDGLTPTAATTSTSKSVVTEISSQVSTTSKPRYKFASRRPYIKKTPSTSTESTSTTVKEEEDDEDNLSHDDQMIEPSIQRIRPHDQLTPNSINELNDKEELVAQEPDESLELLGDIALTLNPFQNAPLPTSRFRGSLKATSTTEKATTTTTSTQRNQASFDRLTYRGRPQRTRISTTSRPEYYTTTPSTTRATATTPVPINYNSLRRRRPQPFEKVTQVPVHQYTTGSYTPITIEYDYYDEGDVRIIGRLPANSKVLIHASGAIQCLDQGNFPHPVSCKKFISCAKMENGDVIGWEYTCPNRLSFDPVGGMCNWSAGLGCKE